MLSVQLCVHLLKTYHFVMVNKLFVNFLHLAAGILKSQPGKSGLLCCLQYSMMIRASWNKSGQSHGRERDKYRK